MQYGVDTVSITPTEFMHDHLLWLELLSRHRGTITAAPSFAYGLVARRLAGNPHVHYDLTSLRFALIGAEPIDSATIDTFVTQCSRHGLAATAMVPGYGLAEATLAVTFAVGTGTILDEPLAAPTIPRDAVRPARRYVRVGLPLSGIEVRVVANDGTVAPTRTVGEVEIRGAAVSACYLTSEGYMPTQHDEGWLATGDLGYFTHGHELVICGRRKDIIIISGRNFYPTDIERTCERVTDVRPGNVVAVRLDVNGGEGFAVIAESFRWEEVETNRAIRLEIATTLQRELGVTPKSVAVVAPNTIPKTTSGKLRRAESSRLLAALA
jgi:fatty-acyl-CoA synthase